MIPQSFADWIKKLKNKLFFDSANNKIVVEGNIEFEDKKRYIHNITLQSSTTPVLELTLQIVNDSETAFTLTTLKSYLLGLEVNEKRAANGYYKDGTYSIVSVVLVYKASATTIGIVGADSTPTRTIATGTPDTLFANATSFVDYVVEVFG